MDKVDRLYHVYEILKQAGDKVSEHEKEYLEILEAAKGNSQEKILACQFIPQHLKHFPNVADKALEAQLDLAEDENIAVRKHAVKTLPDFCKVSKQYVPKIADILTQMLITEEASELFTVQNSLIKVLEYDAKGTLQGILTQISTCEEEAVRKRAMEFLNSKLKLLHEDVRTKEVEEFFLESCKKVFPKVSGQDFLNLLTLVSNLKIARTIPVQITIVDIIASQLDVNGEFNISAESIDGFLIFMKQAYPFFSPFVSSHKFASYIFEKIFPLLNDIKKLDNGQDLVLKLLRGLAEISPFIRDEEHMNEFCETVFNELLNYVPVPPSKDSSENENIPEPDLFFTHIECLLYTLAQLLKHNGSFFTATDNVEKYKDLKLRLSYVNSKVNIALKPLNESQKTAAVMNEEEKLKRIAIFALENIRNLLKDFFRCPFSYKSNITLSWKVGEPGVKRHFEASSSAGSVARKERKSRDIYKPPTGKYSSRVSNPSRF